MEVTRALGYLLLAITGTPLRLMDTPASEKAGVKTRGAAIVD